MDDVLQTAGLFLLGLTAFFMAGLCAAALANGIMDIMAGARSTGRMFNRVPNAQERMAPRVASCHTESNTKPYWHVIFRRSDNYETKMKFHSMAEAREYADKAITGNPPMLPWIYVAIESPQAIEWSWSMPHEPA